MRRLFALVLAASAALPTAAVAQKTSDGLPAARASAEAFAGSWVGAPKGDKEGRELVLHIAPDGAGGFALTYDAPGQAAGASAPATFVGHRITISLAPGVVYTGTLAAAGDKIAGQSRWGAEGNVTPVTFVRAAGRSRSTEMPDPAGLAGGWGGALDMGAFRLPVVVHLTYDGAAYAATFDSPDQGVLGLPAEAAVVRTADGAADSLVVTVAVAGGVLAGRVAAGRDSIAASWTQGGQSLPLALTREGAVFERRRPQEPHPPFPYTTEEVTFAGGEGVTLAGTVTRPPGDGPFPAVVLVSGSGQQDRDETVMGHKPFAVVADHLARRGILALRYDDRGVGGSMPGPDLASATSADFADDARGAVAFLAARPDVSAVGVVGHSEGGMIAPMVAGQTDAVDFVMLLAGPSVRGDAIIARQGVLIAQSAGMSAAGAEGLEAPTLAALGRVVAVPLREPFPDSVRAALQADFYAMTTGMSPEDRAASGLAGGPEADSVYAAGMAERLALPWMRYFFAYDPQPALRALRVPALALFGEKDLQVPPAQSEGPMREALAASASPRWAVEVFDGLNHLFQTAPTGAINEYAEIEETISPAVLERVAEWVLDVTGE